MLNYIWMAMVLVSLLIAVGNDVTDEIRDPFRNGRGVDVTFTDARVVSTTGEEWEARITIPAGAFASHYGTQVPASDIVQNVRFVVGASRTTLFLRPSSDAPERWKAMAAAASDKGTLTGEVRSLVKAGGVPTHGSVIFERIHYVKLRAVTSAALSMAQTAVEIAIGLIGIMALWLGLMKIAEAAGFIAILTRLLRPVTKRLFPDVPHDHPAVGAMIMNIAANMLGLSNAATPMGLKAMEELNKLNASVGSATNAMCTFLVINTSGLVLLPATAIAVRAAAGSDNPGIIIGTSIFGAGCATVAGIVSVKVLERLKMFRVEKEVSHE